MHQINNYYNFKNSVKYFIDIDSAKYPSNTSTFDINHLCWVDPFLFRVRKNEDSFRTLKIPNILNFACAYEHYKDLPNFLTIQSMDSHKRLAANLDTGDFVSGEYDIQLENDFEKLCIYDLLIKVDIKEFYGRIYTHHINFNGKTDRFLSNMNSGATNGLIMGNYLSLYFAEQYLTNISNDFEHELATRNINCNFTYFSDDFYLFCYNHDKEKIIKIFDKVLEKYELERNDNKKENWTYETFNNYNLVARYWKKLIAHCNIRFDNSRNNNKLYYINQIVYRMSKLQDDKLKRVFINNFFKTKYFRTLDFEKYQVKVYDYHQLCFILRYSPEAMLFSVDKFSTMNNFDKGKIIYEFFKSRYHEILLEPYNDEQLYYYYAIKLFDFSDILIQNTNDVLASDNQILISYYLKDGLFDITQVDTLKQLDEEKYWFQNYHMILYTADLMTDLDNSIDKYLIPKRVKTQYHKQTYINFYKENLTSNISFIRDIPSVQQEIDNYLNIKIQEAEASFFVQILPHIDEIEFDEDWSD